MDNENTPISPYYAIGRFCTCMSPIIRKGTIPGLTRSYIDMNILIALAQGGEFCYQRNLEYVVGISHSGIANTLKEMETNGLVTRSTSPSNKRDKIVSLTQKGEDVLAWYLDCIRRFEEIMYAGISQEELELHAKITMQMSANLLEIPESTIKDMPTFEEFQRTEHTDTPVVMPARNQLIFLNLMRNLKDVAQEPEKHKLTE